MGTRARAAASVPSAAPECRPRARRHAPLRPRPSLPCTCTIVTSLGRVRCSSPLGPCSWRGAAVGVWVGRPPCIPRRERTRQAGTPAPSPPHLDADFLPVQCDGDLGRHRHRQLADAALLGLHRQPAAPLPPLLHRSRRPAGQRPPREAAAAAGQRLHGCEGTAPCWGRRPPRTAALKLPWARGRGGRGNARAWGGQTSASAGVPGSRGHAVFAQCRNTPTTLSCWWCGVAVHGGGSPASRASR